MQRYTSSVRGIPLLIFSTFAVGCQLSPSTNSHPSWTTTACREQGMQQKLTKRKVIIAMPMHQIVGVALYWTMKETYIMHFKCYKASNYETVLSSLWECSQHVHLYWLLQCTCTIAHDRHNSCDCSCFRLLTAVRMHWSILSFSVHLNVWYNCNIDVGMVTTCPFTYTVVGLPLWIAIRLVPTAFCTCCLHWTRKITSCLFTIHKWKLSAWATNILVPLRISSMIIIASKLRLAGQVLLSWAVGS